MGLPGTKGRGSVMGRRTPARWGGRAWGYRPLREIVGARPMSRAGGARGWAWVARAQWRWVRRRADHGEHVAGDPEARAGDHAPTCRRVGRWPLAAGGAPSSAISRGRGMTATAVLVARARRRAAGPAWSGTGGRARRAGVISGPTAHQRYVGRPSAASRRRAVVRGRTPRPAHPSPSTHPAAVPTSLPHRAPPGDCAACAARGGGAP